MVLQEGHVESKVRTSTEELPEKKNPTVDAFSPHLTPIHVSTTPSLLSRRLAKGFALSSAEARNKRREKEDRNTSRPLDITGFKHLLMLVLVTGNVKMVWAEWSQFGLWNALANFGFGETDLKMATLIFAFNVLFMPFALALERMTALCAMPGVKGTKIEPRKLHAFIELAAHFAKSGLCVCCLYGGSYLTWRLVDHPLVATGCEANVIVTFLKLVSFVLTNKELRLARKHGEPVPHFYANGEQYPKNLSLKNIVYFWAAPTLIYQPTYPMRPSVRLSRIPPLIGEIVTGMVVIWILMMQIGMPVIEHLAQNFSSWHIFIEDYLTLATTNIMIWLVGFVILFQSTLNLMAEVTKFADRNFYGDWWNAGSVGTFWRDWNRPISNFFRRHLYSPMRAAGFSRMFSANAVFIFSAILHELLFGVATHNFNGVAFLCMIIQPLLILATEPLEKMRGRGTTVGNCVFWISILFGQPTAIVIYYLEWVARNRESKSTTSWWRSILN